MYPPQHEIIINGNFGQKQKSEHYHRIQHIRTILSTNVNLRKTILNFLVKFA